MSRSAVTAPGTPASAGSPATAPAAAAGAAATAGVRIELLERPEALRDAAALWHRVWERAGEPPVSADLLRALTHAGNYLGGAFQDGRMVGALLGFYGGGERPDHVHSHILGVDPDARARGIAFALKLHQRAWTLARGIHAVTWTFDPLVRANAYFNIGKLGATGVEYLVNFYGAMPDAINGGDESDRILLRWDIAGARVEHAVAGGGTAGSSEGAAVALEVGPSQAPVVHAVTAGAPQRCQVPEDIVAIRRADPALAREWRLALRSVMVPALRSGQKVTGMDRSGWYLIS